MRLGRRSGGHWVGTVTNLRFCSAKEGVILGAEAWREIKGESSNTMLDSRNTSAGNLREERMPRVEVLCFSRAVQLHSVKMMHGMAFGSMLN